ncbi:MAG: hypothetical protein IT545_09210 [Rhodobacteraceae bacterium]|nr:hypothetical protein [Paracoccaceae bacterium]
MSDRRRWMTSVLEASAGEMPAMPFARGGRPLRRARPRAIPALASPRALRARPALAAERAAAATAIPLVV